MNRRFALKTFAAFGALSVAAACAPMDEGDDIVDIASSNPDFSTLVTAIDAADLTETLRGPGPFTVFAPTNDAFAALPAGTLDSLLQPENKGQLADVLTYHVVPGMITSDQLVGQTLEVTTVQGETVMVDGTGGKYGAAVRVNDANVTTPDIMATNGVIHVVDKVLLP